MKLRITTDPLQFIFRLYKTFQLPAHCSLVKPENVVLCTVAKINTYLFYISSSERINVFFIKLE